MIEHDPNGYDWAEYGYESYEQYIESKAGSSPRDQPAPAAQCGARVSHPPYYIDDFRCEHPAKYERSGLHVCGIHARVLQRMNGHIPLGWPQPLPPPFEADDENRKEPA